MTLNTNYNHSTNTCTTFNAFLNNWQLMIVLYTQSLAASAAHSFFPVQEAQVRHIYIKQCVINFDWQGRLCYASPHVASPLFFFWVVKLHIWRSTFQLTLSMLNPLVIFQTKISMPNYSDALISLSGTKHLLKVDSLMRPWTILWKTYVRTNLAHLEGKLSYSEVISSKHCPSCLTLHRKILSMFVFRTHTYGEILKS